MNLGRRTVAALAAAMVAFAGTVMVAPAASAAASISCGTNGTGTLGIEQVGSNYRMRLTNSRPDRYLKASILWSPPTPGAPLVWYEGALSQSVTVYSPNRPTSNYPAQMRGYVSGTSSVPSCQSTVAASNY